MLLLRGNRYPLECPICCIYLLCLCPDSRLWAWSQVTRRLDLKFAGFPLCFKGLMLVGARNRNGSRMIWPHAGQHVHASCLDSSLVSESGISLNLVCSGMQACLILKAFKSQLTCHALLWLCSPVRMSHHEYKFKIPTMSGIALKASTW